MRKVIVAGTLALALAGPAAWAQQWSFDVAPGDRLEVALKTGGSIQIRGGDASRVTVKATVGGADAAKIRVAAEKTSFGVRVGSEYTQRLRHSSGSADLEITVPSRFDVTLDTMGGDIRIAGVSGRLSGESMGGALELRHLGGTLALKTMGGAIEVTDSDVDGHVETMGGNVTMRRVRGGLKGKTMGGQVKIEDAPAEAGGTGGEFVASAKGSPSEVDLETMGGDIDVADAPLGAHVQTMGGNVHVGSAAKFVRASTMGGKIRVDRVDGDLKATTMGGDVVAHVVGAGGDVDVESKGGDLDIWLPDGFAATFDVEIAYTRESRRSYQIKSDFPLAQTRTDDWDYGHGSPRKYIRGTGTSGAGTHHVVLHTIDGDIVIHRGG